MSKHYQNAIALASEMATAQFPVQNYTTSYLLLRDPDKNEPPQIVFLRRIHIYNFVVKFLEWAKSKPESYLLPDERPICNAAISVAERFKFEMEVLVNDLPL